MKNSDLRLIGANIAKLRLNKNLKQSELAYEAAVSVRTLQRAEAGEVIKSDGLVKIIRQLGRWDQLLDATGIPAFSPYELVLNASAKPQHANNKDINDGINRKRPVKQRVRRAAKQSTTVSTGRIVWPEDQI